MELTNEMEIKTIDAILNYIRDTVEITPDLIDKLNNNDYEEGLNENYYKEYNIFDFIDANFKINWEVNNLSFGKYVLENNIFNKDDEVEELRKESTLHRCGDEEEQEEQYDDLAFIISRVGYAYLEYNDSDFILDYLNSYYTTPILK